MTVHDRLRVLKALLSLEDQQAAGEERKQDGFGSGGQQPMRMLISGHEPKNRLFYDSSQHDALALSASERAQLTAGPPKTIKHRNTRFHTPAVPQSGASTPGGGTPGGTDTDSQAGGTPGPDATGQPGLRYGMLATPSFTPGAGGESPFMTWGDIAGTPLRLDAEDTPLDIGGGPGPKFSMAAFPRKDAITRHMAAKASSSLKRRAASYAGTPLARQAAAAAAAAAADSSGTPSRAGTPKTGGRTPGRDAQTPLSQAGRRLASTLRAAGKTQGRPGEADFQLRASYRPQTPANGSAPRTSSAGAATLVIDSEDAARLAKLRAAALTNKQRLQEGQPGGKLTDDLLDI